MVERDLERLSIDTSGGWRWTFAYVAMLAGIFIAGAVTKASGYGGHHHVFRAHRVWLYATILTVGYMISRGLGEVRQPRSLHRVCGHRRRHRAGGSMSSTSAQSTARTDLLRSLI